MMIKNKMNKYPKIQKTNYKIVKNYLKIQLNNTHNKNNSNNCLNIHKNNYQNNPKNSN